MPKFHTLAFFLMLLCCPFRGVALPADAYVAVNIPASATLSLDGVADYIRAHYEGTEAQLWALYSWEASHLRYNIEKRNVQLSITNPDELALWSIRNREGVCANFAAVFYAVASRLGVETYMVGGYSVTHNNVRDDGHEWCACIIDGKPFMFDPTWGGGYMLNNVQYVHQLNADFFMVDPQKMVRTHMPEDPLFQFLDYPHYYDEIDNPGADHPVPVFFNWRDSLAVYNAQDSLARMGGIVARMKANGFANDWIGAEIARHQHNYETLLLNRQIDIFNDCVARGSTIYTFVNQGNPVRLPSGLYLRSADDALLLISDIRNRMSDVSAALDETSFSDDSLESGAAHVQSQAQIFFQSLDNLESVLRSRMK